jgi:hypothetical protein
MINPPKVNGCSGTSPHLRRVNVFIVVVNTNKGCGDGVGSEK